MCGLIQILNGKISSKCLLLPSVGINFPFSFVEGKWHLKASGCFFVLFFCAFFLVLLLLLFSNTVLGWLTGSMFEFYLISGQHYFFFSQKHRGVLPFSSLVLDSSVLGYSLFRLRLVVFPLYLYKRERERERDRERERERERERFCHQCVIYWKLKVNAGLIRYHRLQHLCRVWYHRLQLLFALHWVSRHINR